MDDKTLAASADATTEKNAPAEAKLSPTALGHAHRRDVAVWTCRWGYTSASLIQRLLRKKAAGWASTAVKRGLLNHLNTASGRPCQIFTLASWGLELAQQHFELKQAYPYRDPTRVQQQLVRHHLICQLLTLNALQQGTIQAYCTEREWVITSAPGVKQPDAVWIMEGGLRIGLEVELTAKWDRHLDEFVLGVTTCLTASPQGEPQLDGFIVATDSAALLRRYRAALTAGARLALWEKDNRGHWRTVNTTTVSADASARVNFMLIKPELI
jgi:hypothetical protein